MFSLLQQRIAAAAAILLLAGNVYTMLQYQEGIKRQVISTEKFVNHNLISDFKLYD